MQLIDLFIVYLFQFSHCILYGYNLFIFLLNYHVKLFLLSLKELSSFMFLLSLSQ